MLGARRQLPSIASLAALDAVARLGSVTSAADELSLTQSAVSRQLQTLETQLGVPLFVRKARRISLTPAGIRYAEDAARALGILTSAAIRLQTNPSGGTLTLAILPTFGMRWLVPRLPRFARTHPDVTINMNTRLGRVDFAREGIDAAIHFGEKPEGMGALLLDAEHVLPLAAPELLKEPIVHASDLTKLPLLHIQTRPDAWSDWFAAEGVERKAQAGMRYDQFSTILQAARHGLGVALVPEYLAREELSEGRLKIAFGAPRRSRGSYWLIWPEEQAEAPALKAFRNWLSDEIAGEDLLPR